jgi:thymidine kinase
MGLSIIMGNMFSGKTSELIRRLKRLKVLGKQIMVINSAKDTRSPDEVLKTHDNVKFDCHKVFELLELIETAGCLRMLRLSPSTKRSFSLTCYTLFGSV